MYIDNYRDFSFVGKKILAAEINTAKDCIIFETDAGVFNLFAYGDCCSNSWFEHISGVDSLIGQVVNTEDEIEMGEISRPAPDEGYGKYIQSYSLKLATDKGHFEIEMRNSSNGYYGGSFYIAKNPVEGPWAELQDC